MHSDWLFSCSNSVVYKKKMEVRKWKQTSKGKKSDTTLQSSGVLNALKSSEEREFSSSFYAGSFRLTYVCCSFSSVFQFIDNREKLMVEVFLLVG